MHRVHREGKSLNENMRFETISDCHVTNGRSTDIKIETNVVRIAFGVQCVTAVNDAHSAQLWSISYKINVLLLDKGLFTLFFGPVGYLSPFSQVGSIL